MVVLLYHVWGEGKNYGVLNTSNGAGRKSEINSFCVPCTIFKNFISFSILTPYDLSLNFVPVKNVGTPATYVYLMSKLMMNFSWSSDSFHVSFSQDLHQTEQVSCADPVPPPFRVVKACKIIKSPAVPGSLWTLWTLWSVS